VERRVRVGGAWTAGMRKARTKSVTRQASVVGCCGEARSVTSQAACGARPASGVGQGSQSAPPAFACL
jgi:hypothetical protein